MTEITRREFGRLIGAAAVSGTAVVLVCHVPGESGGLRFGRVRAFGTAGRSTNRRAAPGGLERAATRPCF
jgi:hypothetical protein